jgi:hypothetical protein
VLIVLSTYSNGQNQHEENPPSDTGFVMQKSPWGAVLRSAVLPGFGQFYNESYWKIPIIWGAGALLISGWVYNNNLYKDNKDLFINTGQTIYQYRRDFYRNQRDNFSIYLVVLYILNLVDAYVDAQLYDFTVEEDFITGSSRANFRFYF